MMRKVPSPLAFLPFYLNPSTTEKQSRNDKNSLPPPAALPLPEDVDAFCNSRQPIILIMINNLTLIAVDL